jgi:hypothetical protein
VNLENTDVRLIGRTYIINPANSLDKTIITGLSRIGDPVIKIITG